MEHKVKKIVEEIDMLEVLPEEYNRINELYRASLIEDGLPVKYVKELEVTKVILSDDALHKKEFMLQISPDALNNREAEAKIRHDYLESLEKKADEEQKEILKAGL